jgi:hypothetical protein
MLVRILVGLVLVRLLGFLGGARISWLNRLIGAEDSVGSYPVGAGDSLSCCLVRARVSL